MTTKAETPIPPTASVCDRCGAHQGFEECTPACWEAAKREGLELVAGGAETLMMRYRDERDDALAMVRRMLGEHPCDAECTGLCNNKKCVAFAARARLARITL